jgi:raffinose/stachyose/melibiose transport system substrate-binding protein
MIDKVCSTPEQQKAAKDFLNWLVNSEKGQDFLVNVCNVVPAFSNIQLEVKNPLGISVQNCVENGQLFDGYIYYPGDHWKEVGASMQKYLVDQITREELAKEITSYWDALK